MAHPIKRLLQYTLGFMEHKQALVIRCDLGMGKGKIASQASHAALIAADKSEYKNEWVSQGQKKTVLKVSGERELIEIFQYAKDMGLPVSLVEDAGHTQIPPGTKTAVGIGPAPEGDIDKITGGLKLL
jgi:peptidyl-tRNA hydrolase, PTH2 family